MLNHVRKVIALVGLITALTGAFPAAVAAQGGIVPLLGFRPDGEGIGIRAPNPLRQRFRIQYHTNGAVLVATPNIYFIWYGNWAGNSAQTILTNFTTSLGGTDYYGINTLYPDVTGARPSNGLIFAGAIEDPYSRGTTLTKADVATVVHSAINNVQLPLDPNGIYFVLASADVTVSGYCRDYCGLHNHTTVVGTSVKYGFIGNPERCPSKCAPQTVSPNGNTGADAMTSILANLISTTVTDPFFTAWFDRLGFENADKCAWTFGSTYRTPNGARANINLGGRDYLLQQNWVPTPRGGFCALGVNP